MLVTGALPGLAYQRNAALDMMHLGEWAAFLCDDYRNSYALPKDLIFSSTNKLKIDTQNQNAFRLRKPHNLLSLGQVFEYFPKLIEIAEQNGIHLVGFALHDNPMGLANKFSTRGLADGRFWLVKKSSYRFDENVQLIDDVAWTCENLIRHGKVLILNWLIPYFRRYTSGGFGSIGSRLQLRRKECTYLCKKYYPLVKSAEKPGWPSGTHLKIFGAPKNISIVRERILRIKKL